MEREEVTRKNNALLMPRDERLIIKEFKKRIIQGREERLGRIKMSPVPPATRATP